MNNNIKIDKYGVKRYYVNNVLHREDGPAVEYPNSSKYWYKNGKRHREIGPAVETFYGDKQWYKNGKVHRDDGPAIEYVYGDKEWYLNDVCYGYNNDFTNESWIKFIKTLIFS